MIRTALFLLACWSAARADPLPPSKLPGSADETQLAALYGLVGRVQASGLHLRRAVDYKWAGLGVGVAGGVIGYFVGRVDPGAGVAIMGVSGAAILVLEVLGVVELGRAAKLLAPSSLRPGGPGRPEGPLPW